LQIWAHARYIFFRIVIILKEKEHTNHKLNFLFLIFNPSHPTHIACFRKTYAKICVSLSPWHDMPSGYGQRRWPPGMNGSCKCIE
jgi:hypothetical protein